MLTLLTCHQKFTVSTLFFMTRPGPITAPPYHHGDLRNALVEAAVELARQGGPGAIVLREAARRVGVSATAAYRHFGSLPELVEAVAGECLAALARSMEAELADYAPTGIPAQDAVAAMRAVGRGYVHFATEEPGLFATAFSGVKEHANPVGASGLSAWGLLERALDGLVDAGVMAAADRTAAATMAWAVVHGLSELFLGPLQEVPAAERAGVIDATLDLVGRGLFVRN
jgi:AcrR family transcriptional regulator